MYRNGLRALKAWKTNKRRKPLIVWGARQVGKTYLIKNIFAEEEFSGHYIYIDLKLEKEINEYCMETVHPKEIISFISAIKNRRITKDTLLIFDEVQECLGILTALKYFCQDYREIPVIATGSMVRTRMNRIAKKTNQGKEGTFLFPVGKINQLTLYPMSFDEFLFNYNPGLFEQVKGAYEKRMPLEPHMHALAMDILYKYLLVGGMPEAVEAFLETEEYYESGQILKDLYDNYLADMELYQASSESILRSRKIFENIYMELNKENKNFKCSVIEKGLRNRDLQNPMDWLETACVVNRSYLLNERITLPLRPDNESIYRLYLADIGMFTYQSGLNAASFLMKNKRNALAGIFFENYVANELVAKGHKLFFWKGRSSAEMEFVAESKGEFYPIDVKRGRASLNSLKKYREHNPCVYAVKVSENNFGFNREQGILTLPLYSFFLWAENGYE
ncbi:MAG: ATP-binding protein [Lachnospiraceae bacterium]|nr:ATP-binding protein [Lachnospiraceae bacterium]